MPNSAFAGGKWSNKCEQAGNKAKAACEASSNGAKAADVADGNATASALKKGGVENLGTGQSAHAKRTADRLNAAKAECEKKKEECSSECDKEEKDRKSKLGRPPQDPERQQAQADTQVEEKKQSACIVPIAAMAGDLGKGAGDALAAMMGAAAAAGAAMAANKKNEDDKKALEEAMKGDLSGNDKLNCAIEENSKLVDCNSYYTEKCGNSSSAPGCTAFINRYCGANTPAQPTPAPGNDNLSISAQSAAQNAAVTANLVVGKDGEGLGSAFCKKITAQKFCAMAGRSECPSCKNINSPWPMEANAGQMADAKKACPTDPMFMDMPAANANIGSTNTSAAGNVSTSSINDRFGTQSVPGEAGAGSGGGSGAMGGAGGAGTAPTPGSGVSEGQGYSGPSLADGSGYGGGAGGSYEGSASGPGYEPASVNGDARRAPAASVAGGPRDVAQQYGPNIFSIQSTTYRSMCARGRFLHCRR